MILKTIVLLDAPMFAGLASLASLASARLDWRLRFSGVGV